MAPADCRQLVLVGGGGKTTTLYALAKEARDAGRTVLVTTTTHILPHPRLALAEDPAQAAGLLAAAGIAALGRREPSGKLSGVPTDYKALADVVLSEGDGAKMLPLKAPADHEPVIPAGTDAVIAVAGLDAVGRTIGESCHRPERVCALLDKPPEHVLGPGDVAELLASPFGGRKSVGEAMAFRCLLNKADDPQRRAWAGEIRTLLAARGIPAAVHHYAEEERGGLCWF